MIQSGRSSIIELIIPAKAVTKIVFIKAEDLSNKVTLNDVRKTADIYRELLAVFKKCLEQEQI